MSAGGGGEEATWREENARGLARARELRARAGLPSEGNTNFLNSLDSITVPDQRNAFKTFQIPRVLPLNAQKGVLSIQTLADSVSKRLEKMKYKSFDLRTKVFQIKNRIDALNTMLQASGKKLQGDERKVLLARVSKIITDIYTRVRALDYTTERTGGLRDAIGQVENLVGLLEAQSGIPPVAGVNASTQASAAPGVNADTQAASATGVNAGTQASAVATGPSPRPRRPPPLTPPAAAALEAARAAALVSAYPNSSPAASQQAVTEVLRQDGVNEAEALEVATVIGEASVEINAGKIGKAAKNVTDTFSEKLMKQGIFPAQAKKAAAASVSVMTAKYQSGNVSKNAGDAAMEAAVQSLISSGIEEKDARDAVERVNAIVVNRKITAELATKLLNTTVSPQDGLQWFYVSVWRPYIFNYVRPSRDRFLYKKEYTLLHLILKKVNADLPGNAAMKYAKLYNNYMKSPSVRRSIEQTLNFYFNVVDYQIKRKITPSSDVRGYVRRSVQESLDSKDKKQGLLGWEKIFAIFSVLGDNEEANFETLASNLPKPIKDSINPEVIAAIEKNPGPVSVPEPPVEKQVTTSVAHGLFSLFSGVFQRVASSFKGGRRTRSVRKMKASKTRRT